MWSKLDRAMLNGDWVLAEFNSLANFLPLRCLSIIHHTLYHSLGMIEVRGSPFDSLICGPTMKLYKIVGKLRLEERNNSFYVKSCKVLRLSLKSLMRNTLPVLSKRVEMATLALKEMQVDLHDDPLNVEL